MQEVNWKQHYSTLGRLVVAKNPEVAFELLHKYCLQMQPVEIDSDRIPVLYERFCFTERLQDHQCRGPLYKSAKVEKRRLFIAAMLHLFQPQIYHQPKDDFLLKGNGFIRKLASTIRVDHGNLSRWIQEIVSHELYYPEFRENVQLIVNRLSNG
jgi:hypothetical protein